MANSHLNCKCDWTVAGIAIGWSMMAFSIGQTAFFVCLTSFSDSEIFYIVTLWVFGELNINIIQFQSMLFLIYPLKCE